MNKTRNVKAFIRAVGLDTRIVEEHDPSTAAPAPPCRFCDAPLTSTFADLGMSPIANSYLTREQLGAPEPYFPLRALVCDACFLVQLEAVLSPEATFGDYAYSSSYSDTWLAHAADYARMAVDRFSLSPSSRVVEIASNDGCLLRNFLDRKIPVLGVEPARNVAHAALQDGVPTRVAFFSASLAEQLVSEGRMADLIVANNVLAHIPDLNDFVRGMKLLLKPQGVITIEFPHLLQLIGHNQFDTIYHEHLCYFSLLTVEKILAKQGLAVTDVDELPTHGGSLRVYCRHAGQVAPARGGALENLRNVERRAGLNTALAYGAFAEQVKEAKRNLLAALIDIKRSGATIAAYGAPAKGNTLLNYCGIGRDFIDYAVDRNPYKQGRWLPGTHIPICTPERIALTRPGYILILPWNIAGEIMDQISYAREWGARFIIPIPKPEIRA